MDNESQNWVSEGTMGVPPPPNDGDSDPPAAAGVPDSNSVQASDTGVAWKDQLNLCKRRIEALQEKYDQSYLEIGKELIQARDIYKGHGDWIHWLKNNVPFSVRHAQRLIRVAEMFADTDLVEQLGLTSSKAFILARVGKNDLEYFCLNFFPLGGMKKHVNQMSKRELELVVKNFLKSKLVPKDREEKPSDPGKQSRKSSVESNFDVLREAMDRAIASIKGEDSELRNSWISELEEMYKTGLEQLETVSE